ncbi:MAG: flagellar hook-length control protein FliK [Roseobacter sp.]
MLDLPILQSQTQNAHSGDSGGTKSSTDTPDKRGETAFESEYRDADEIAEAPDKTTENETVDASKRPTSASTEAEDTPVPVVEGKEMTGTGDKMGVNVSEPGDVLLFEDADTTGVVKRSENENAVVKTVQAMAQPESILPPSTQQNQNATKRETREQPSPQGGITAPVASEKQPPPKHSTAETVVLTRALEATEKQSVGIPEGAKRSDITGSAIAASDKTAEAASRPHPVAVSPAKSEDARFTPQTPAQTIDARKPLKLDREAVTETPDLPPVRTASQPLLPAALNGANQIAHSKLVTVQDRADPVKHVIDSLDVAGPFDQRTAQQTHSTQLQQMLHRTDTPAMIARQMAEALQKLPDRPVEISLNPKELGRVRMNISAVEAGITVSVVAERPETLDLMRRNIDQLAREFETIGYNNINFAFSQGETQQEFSNQQKEATNTSSSHLDLEYAEDGNPINPTALPTTGVDIRV